MEGLLNPTPQSIVKFLKVLYLKFYFQKEEKQYKTKKHELHLKAKNICKCYRKHRCSFMHVQQQLPFIAAHHPSSKVLAALYRD